MSQIEGVPAGVKVVAYRPAKDGDHVIHEGYECPQSVGHRSHYSGNQLVVEKDNVYDVWLLDFVKIQEGYERAGDKPEEWFREPIHGDTYLSRISSYGTYNPIVFGEYYCNIKTEDPRRIILRKKATKKRFLVLDEEIEGSGIPYLRYNVGNGPIVYPRFRIEEREVA